MKKIVAITAALTVSSFTFACEKPAQPALPELEGAVVAQMVKAQSEVKKYLAASEAYLECVNSTSKHNAMVSEMKLVGNNFNELIRAFKARQKA